MKVSALIPVKGFRNAKQRLSASLEAAEREILAEAMFRDVLRQVVGTPGLAETCVVTGDARVAQIAASLGAEVLRESAENGETDAVNFARYELKRSGREAILILPADMPLVQRQDIEALLVQASPQPGVPFALLVPSHDRLGTNALLLAPPDLIQLRFGYDSFSYHMSQLASQGLPLRFLENEHIALDIDERKDLERFIAYGYEGGDTYQIARKLLAHSEAANNDRREPA